jgi:hypothetical protein
MRQPCQDACSALGIKKSKCCPANLPCTADHTSSFVFPSKKLEKFRCISLQSSCSTKRIKLLRSFVSPLNLNVDEEDVVVAPVESSPSDRINDITLESCFNYPIQMCS